MEGATETIARPYISSTRSSPSSVQALLRLVSFVSRSIGCADDIYAGRSIRLLISEAFARRGFDVEKCAAIIAVKKAAKRHPACSKGRRPENATAISTDEVHRRASSSRLPTARSRVFLVLSSPPFPVPRSDRRLREEVGRNNATRKMGFS